MAKSNRHPFFFLFFLGFARLGLLGGAVFYLPLENSDFKKITLFHPTAR